MNGLTVVEAVAGDAARAPARRSRSASEPPGASSTFALVGSSTQSSRRSTVSGRMTLPYSDCL